MKIRRYRRTIEAFVKPSAIAYGVCPILIDGKSLEKAWKLELSNLEIITYHMSSMHGVSHLRFVPAIAMHHGCKWSEG